MDKKYRERIRKSISVYKNHYDLATDKFSAVQNFIAIKNELKLLNKETEKSIREDINHFILNVNAEDEWAKKVDSVFRFSLLGYKASKEEQEQIIILTDESKEDETTTKVVKLILQGCSVLSDRVITIRELGWLIAEITDKDYPKMLSEDKSKNSSDGMGRKTINGPDFISVKNIIREMAVMRSGPDKRSNYSYEDIFQTLMKKFNNPELRYKDLNTEIAESTFSTMWTKLKKDIKDIDISDLDK